jgi:hypothetical protein
MLMASASNRRPAKRGATGYVELTLGIWHSDTLMAHWNRALSMSSDQTGFLAAS